MPLILTDETMHSWSSSGIPEEAIGGYIFVNKNLLSIPYAVGSGTKIEASILKLTDSKSKNIPELESEKIIFIFVKGSGSRDFLFISNESWTILRDYGIILDGTYISIKIEKIIKGTEETLIYPKRDVSD